MLDFLKIKVSQPKRGTFEIKPSFLVKNSSDLMIRGGDFYAIWVENRHLWSTDENDALQLIDYEINKHLDEHKDEYAGSILNIYYMWDGDSGMIDKWHKYCQKQKRDTYHMLDEEIIFSDTETVKEDYASKKLNYPLQICDIHGYEKLMSTLYSEEERHKIEWAIGSIITGESKNIQKFMVLYGSAGTGKSTVLNIIQQLFEGYYTVFDAKALGSSSNSFALEAFKTNPMVAIQHDGDLSKIEDNTRLNSLVSHEYMTVNEKYKSAYTNQFKCFLFMGTNKPVKITDAKSGLLRRLIDVSPSGNKLAAKEYNECIKQIPFELGGIAYHCKEIFLANPGAYDSYVPVSMMSATNDFYNFVEDAYFDFKKEEIVTLKSAWEMYKLYCEDAKVPYQYPRRSFKEELKNYFEDFKERGLDENGNRIRSYYIHFLADKVDNIGKEPVQLTERNWLDFKEQESLFDKECSNWPAQYSKMKGSQEIPILAWKDVTTRLSDLDTSKVHYVKIPNENLQHIVIDFDIPDESGNKCFAKNFEAAKIFPKTYAELSKSGQGIHLHYIYTGDVSKLSRLFDDHIEIKVFNGGSSLRRKLTKCNNEPIAHISGGLPLRKEKDVIDKKTVESEKTLRYMIEKNLRKEYHPSTASSVSFIKKLLDDAYDSGMPYDVTDMYNYILSFGAKSTHQADNCLKMISQMHFKSEMPVDPIDAALSLSDTITNRMEDNVEENLVFYDIEIFPNLFLINWKLRGKDKPVIRMINPTREDVEALLSKPLVGFNCRRYDNHLLYAYAMLKYSIEDLYNLSQSIIGNKPNVLFGNAYNISYIDVYDMCTKKQSLKKWEIELGIHHQELGLPWDQPVPEELWEKVAEYCDNDVIATEAVFDARQEDYEARKIQVELVKALWGMTNVSVNDTTNTLSAKIIFGSDRNAKASFNWRDLSKPVGEDQYAYYRERFGEDYKFRVFDADGLPLYKDYDPSMPLPKRFSILPFFPGYTYEGGVSTYLGEKIGEGGRVFARPGIWSLVWDGDVGSQHPHSAIFEVAFGPKYTKIFKEIVDARIAIKHKDFEKAAEMLKGVLKPYLNEEHAKGLAQALKIVINSIYGLTKARFDNPFKNPNNIDNIVAKRGALFMTLLKREVEKRGYTVCHIKTDSIKIPNADETIKKFVIDFGLEYGYKFETEAEFQKFCLVNDAVYVAKYMEPEIDKKTGKEIWWTATGKQFQVPYVFKTLFSHEPIVFKDMCETKSVESALYLDMNERLPDVTKEEKELSKLESKYKKGELSDTSWQEACERLKPIIASGHDYHFVGKVGQFTPMQDGCGAGLLRRAQNDKYYAAPESDGYRWMESEMVKELGLEDKIDKSFYITKVDEAVATISKYGDFEWLVSDDEPEDEPLPFS